MKKFKVLFLAAALIASPIVATVAPVSEISVEAASAKSFSDVSKNNAYYSIINNMTAQGIIKGYEDGTFKPEQSLSRKHAAQLIHRLDKLKKPSTSKAVPKDLTAKHPNYEAIMMLYNHNLLSVDSTGKINPNKDLSRGEMAKILATVFKLTGSKHPLKDVSKGINGYVAALYENNVTTGFEDKTFKEKQSLTRAHYAVFMHRAMNPEQAAPSVSDSLVTRKLDSVADAVLPAGEKDAKALTEKLKAAYSKAFNEKGLNKNGGFNVVRKSSILEQTISIDAKNLKMTEKEFIEKINEAYKTGKLITDEGKGSVPYAMYFNYTSGMLTLGIKLDQ